LRFNVRYAIYIQLQHAQVFHNKPTGKEYTIFCNVNCKTPNVVYLLVCHVCGSQCVGESVQPFNKRMNGHRSDRYKKDALSRESTLCVAGALIGWFCQIENVYHWPQSKLERESKTYKRECLDPRDTNMTSEGQKQKGQNLLRFLFILFMN
jgi:hypothetical protein